MITSVKIERLRGIREGILADLPRLCILVGKNGCGKSTVLDAIAIATSPATMINSMMQRRREMRHAPRWLLFRAGEEGAAGVEVAGEGGAWAGVKLDWKPDQITHVASEPAGPPVPAVSLVEAGAGGMHGELHNIYSEAARKGRAESAIEVLRTVIPDLRDIRILTEGREPVVHLMFADHSVPVALCGDGMVTLVQLAFELASRSAGTVLLEEPETHLHPAAILRGARLLLAATRRGIQIILATHSLELIDAILAEAETADMDQMAVFRLALDAGTLRSTRISGRDAARLRGEIEEDLR